MPTRKLPFVVQPRLQAITERIGTEESGIIEIERRGYLSVAEKAMVQGSVGDDDVMRGLVSLAARVSRETGRQQQEVIQDLTKQPPADYLEPWGDEISALLMQMVSFQERTVIIQATAMWVSRINPEWTIEDTLELHPDLLNGLVELYQDEDRRSVEVLEASAEGNGGAVEGKS